MVGPAVLQSTSSSGAPLASHAAPPTPPGPPTSPPSPPADSYTSPNAASGVYGGGMEGSQGLPRVIGAGGPGERLRPGPLPPSTADAMERARVRRGGHAHAPGLRQRASAVGCTLCMRSCTGAHAQPAPCLSVQQPRWSGPGGGGGGHACAPP